MLARIPLCQYETLQDDALGVLAVLLLPQGIRCGPEGCLPPEDGRQAVSALLAQ